MEKDSCRVSWADLSRLALSIKTTRRTPSEGKRCGVGVRIACLSKAYEKGLRTEGVTASTMNSAFRRGLGANKKVKPTSLA
jgi:hypothetical protein